MSDHPHETTRRDFLKQTGSLVAGAAALSLAGRAAAEEKDAKAAGAPSGDKIVLGLIGPGGQGMNLLNSFVRQSDVEVAWVCDVDDGRTANAASVVQSATGKSPKTGK